MDSQPITCELVDERELDRRYVAGRLTDDEAAAFEAHYFSCDRCWGLVKGGAQVRAGEHREAFPAASRSRPWSRTLAIAAGIALVMIGTWRVVGSNAPSGTDVVRGEGDSLAVRSTISAGRWEAAWPSARGQASYRVRIFADDGRLLLTHETKDTTVGLAADSLSVLGRGATLFFEVERLDALRRPVGRSPLVPLR